MYYLFDTCVLFDLFVDTEKTFQLEDVLPDKIFLIDAVLFELITLIKVRVNTQKATAVLEDILKNADLFVILKYDSSDYNQAKMIMIKYDNHNPKTDFSMADALQLAIAGREHLGLYTDDQRLLIYPKNLVKVENPLIKS